MINAKQNNIINKAIVTVHVNNRHTAMAGHPDIATSSPCTIWWALTASELHLYHHNGYHKPPI